MSYWVSAAIMFIARKRNEAMKTHRSAHRKLYEHTCTHKGKGNDTSEIKTLMSCLFTQTALTTAKTSKLAALGDVSAR